jgi:hypothetical protein
MQRHPSGKAVSPKDAEGADMSEQTIGQHNLKAAAVWHSGWSRRRSQRLSFNRDWTSSLT